MPKPLDAREIEFAYEAASFIAPNIKTDMGFKTRITIDYELQDSSHNYLKNQSVEHYSEATEDRMTAEQVTLWISENRDKFIAEDKKLLSGYGEHGEI